uniref:Uncharacterized protein n=1 Tax=Nonomuraea gerenzanensis TaxID=93944 RepID=A0A1M4EQZ6_9ACTN|nr:hypothetical protein BN4615_P10764 [Nonomuraea gerenzanensis]
MYELCVAGGLSFVRRTDGDQAEHVLESHWMSTWAARALWVQIVTGAAG